MQEIMQFDMHSLNASFIKSAADPSQCPPPLYPEYAFTGRSNVGKSSLINALCGTRHLAKTSSTPGKTRLINHFLVNGQWYLADLPGYGYAKASRRERSAFMPLLTQYLLKRTNLLCTFLLIDARHAPQANDVSFMEWLAEQELPFMLVFTKTDKLGKQALQNRLTAYKMFLEERWEQLPLSILTSAITGRGLDQMHQFISENNRQFMPEQRDFKP